MTLLTECALAALALLGHFSLCVSLHNWLHAMPIPPKLMKASTILVFLFLVLAPPALAAWWLFAWGWPAGLRAASFHYLPFGYLCVTWAIAAVATPVWVFQRWGEGGGKPSLTNRTTRHPLSSPDGSPLARGFATTLLQRIPGNQTMELWAQTKELPIFDLPPTFDGLTITHLTDLHMMDHLALPYFQQVIDITNALKSDLVAVTGDIVERPQCLSWLAPTLGRLTAPLGVFFIFGNHDYRMKAWAQARRLLVEECGLVDALGRVVDVFPSPTRRGAGGEGGTAMQADLSNPVLKLAGNELPWAGPAPQFEDPRQPSEFRLLLSHTPDNIRWAQANDVQLMLAGHTHGGQIRFPVIGPVVCPSYYGVKYAAGLFYEPPTLLHVCRGISGEQAIRLNCAPEVTKLILRRPPRT